MSRSQVSNTSSFDFDLNRALGDWDAQRNIMDPSYSTTGSGENIAIQWDPHDRQNFTWQDPDSGKKYVLSGSDAGYNVRGDFDVGEKGLVSSNNYDPTGKYLNSQYWNRGKSGDDLLGVASILSMPFIVGGAQALGLMGGANPVLAAEAGSGALGGMAGGGAVASPVYGGSAAGMELAPLGEVGAGAIPEGVAFTPATAGEMAGMGLGGGGGSGLLNRLGSKAIDKILSNMSSQGSPTGGGGGMSGAGGISGIRNTHAIAELMDQERRAKDSAYTAPQAPLPLGAYEAQNRANLQANLLRRG